MSVNRHQPHVFVLPEDDANRQIVNGFLLDPLFDTRKMLVLVEAGGWREVLRRFALEHVTEMDRNPQRFMILLIDFDQHDDRLEQAKASVPPRLQDRVFVLGVWSEPEDLRRTLQASFEEVGRRLAQECREQSDHTWGHPLLACNADELVRLRQSVCPFLFRAD